MAFLLLQSSTIVRDCAMDMSSSLRNNNVTMSLRRIHSTNGSRENREYGTLMKPLEHVHVGEPRFTRLKLSSPPPVCGH